ncbi:MAG: NUDIX domain-containing protein [bacterium]|nr:NUDIX domain-containing protein [bacterium]
MLVDPQTHKFLVMCRSDYKNDGGVWDMIGGKVETGEDAKEALRREAKEETQISLQTLRPLDLISHITSRGDFFIFALRVCEERTLNHGEIQLSHEHTDYKRVRSDEFLRLPLKNSVAKVKDQIVSYMCK